MGLSRSFQIINIFPMMTVYGVCVPAAVLLALALLSWAYKWATM